MAALTTHQHALHMLGLNPDRWAPYLERLEQSEDRDDLMLEAMMKRNGMIS